MTKPRQHTTAGRATLVDVLQVRHRVCTCMGDCLIGKPIKCYKRSPDTPSDQELLAKECIVGCGHFHLYSRAYLRRMALLREINRLGEGNVLKILKGTKEIG